MTAGDVYRALWRHKWLILALTALCVAGTWYVTSLATKTYKASTLVRVQQRGAGNSFNSLDASVSIAQTYAEIIDSGAITDSARTLVKGRIPSSLVEDVRLSAEPVPDLSLIWISAEGEHPVGVAGLANASPSALRSAAGKYGTPGDQIVTVTRAGTPSAAISPDMTLNIALALALGLLFNCGLVLIYEVLRDRLPKTGEFEEVLGYPVLASIPTLRLKPIATVAEGTLDRYERKPEFVSQPGAGDGRADQDAPT